MDLDRAACDAGPPFWYNELTGSTQYQHPVDHFIKNTLKLVRTGYSSQVKPANSFRRLSLLGEAEGTRATGRARHRAAS